MTVRQADLSVLRRAIAHAPLRPLRGRVERVQAGLVQARLTGVRLGELCRLEDGGEVMEAEVVAIAGASATLAPIGELSGLSSRAAVIPTGRALHVAVGEGLLGRVLDGLGRPLDGAPLPSDLTTVPIAARPPTPLQRPPVDNPLPLGIRAVDGLLTCATGQRIGIFGAAGTGKSSLIARIVQTAAADVFVVALVGERGREVAEFLDRALGEAGRGRAVVVAATSDRPALERVKAAEVATAIAEWFRDSGRRVVLLVDSLTRLARAWREIGLAAGEPPTRRGYPPSVFAALPRLLERGVSSLQGSITAFYAVLVEGDVAADPIAEEVKSILDGHLVLSPELAAIDHHPAIDVLASRSRVMAAVVDEDHRHAAGRLRALLARHGEVELLLRVGEYQAGGDPLADEAIRKIEAIRAFLRDGTDAPTSYAAVRAQLRALAA